MSFSFWLKQLIESERFTRVDYLERTNWEYFVRVTSLDQLDDEVQAWLCLAYEVGCQRA